MSSAELSTITSGIDIRVASTPRPGALVVLRGRIPVNELHPWIGDALTVGRGDACSLQLTDDLKAARDHASIRYLGDDRWEITDRASKNGTFVNGDRVKDGPVVLRGKVIIVRCGESVLLLGDWQSYTADGSRSARWW